MPIAFAGESPVSNGTLKRHPGFPNMLGGKESTNIGFLNLVTAIAKFAC